jgi:glucose-6-phosphate 1-dehydrogenase
MKKISMLKKLFTLFLVLTIFPLKTIHADEKPSQPTAIVIFGATGDLTSRKLIPALYELDKSSDLSEETSVLGIGRRAYSKDEFRSELKSKVKGSSEKNWEPFEKRIAYLQADFKDPAGYEKLKSLLDEHPNRLFYLATPPECFEEILENLHDVGLLESEKEGWTRVVIEKPFGKDLDSAVLLQEKITSLLDDDQVFRIDHYLGKEGLQKLLDLRFKSGVFEPVWNNKYIDHVQITLSEDIGICSRGAFWEQTGLIRDLFQNHLMQLLTITAMEPPVSNDIHAKKIELLQKIRPVTAGDMVLGQYKKGVVKGSEVVGYLEEKGVSENSQVETFAAGKFFIDNERWSAVPFYIRAGKRMPLQTAEICIVFKEQEFSRMKALYIRIQPNPEVFVKTGKKGDYSLQPVSLPKSESREAYAKLILSALNGDKSLFVEADEQIASWKLFSSVLESTKETLSYEAGSWGPDESDDLLENDGRSWQTLQ